MSEPYGAFVRLHVARADLVHWLETSPPDPARWTDWRDLGGRWCLDDGAEELAQATAEEMATYAREAGERLARWPTMTTWSSLVSARGAAFGGRLQCARAQP